MRALSLASFAPSLACNASFAATAKRAAWRLLPALLLGVALAGCGSSAGTTTPGAGQTRQGATPTTPPTATATLKPTQKCQVLPSFAGAGVASAGSAFPDLGFPSGSSSAAIASSAGGDGRFAIQQLDVCAPGSSVAAVHSFYATGLPGNGFAQSDVYPYDGGAQTPCGDPYCWKKDTAPRYVSLEQVTDHGGGLVTFHLRLALPPHAPSCTPDPYSLYATRPYDATLPGTANVPAPPLTKAGIGSAGTVGGVTRGGTGGECSAGTVDSVNTFFTAELPKNSWTNGPLPATLATACGASGAQWYKGNDTFSWNTVSGGGASGVFWGYGFCHVG